MFESEEKRNAKRQLLGLLIFTLISFGITVILLRVVYSEIDAMLYRAQVSVDADKMALRLQELSANMERRGMTSGYIFPLFGSPVGDMALDYEAIIDARERALLLAAQDPSSPQYQSGMDDLRGTLREIDLEGWVYAMWRNLFFYITVALVIWMIIIVIKAPTY